MHEVQVMPKITLYNPELSASWKLLFGPFLDLKKYIKVGAWIWGI